MDLTINYYKKELPKVGDVVTVLMKEPHNDIIEASIEEYPLLIGIFQLADLTNKKKIRSVRKYLKKIPVPAEVTDINKTTKIISLSRRYLRDLENDYQKYYQEKLRLCNIVKNIHRNFLEDDFNNIFKTLIYPINSLIENEIKDNEIPQIFNIIEQKFKNKNFIHFGKYNEFINKTFEKIFKEKPIKVITEFSLMCSLSVNNIISLFEDLKQKYPKVTFRLKSIPSYYIETTGIKDIETEFHSQILKYIKIKTKELKIVYKKY